MSEKRKFGSRSKFVVAGAIAGLVSFGGLPLAAAAEDRGTVQLNDEGNGVDIEAHTGGTPSSQTRNERCTVYKPALRYELSDVLRDQVRDESDFDSLVRQGEGDDEELLVRRTCKGGTTTDPATGKEVRVRLTQQSHWVSLKRLVGDLARSAVDAILFPPTRARFSPPARTRTLVGVDTWFWVPATAWRPITKVVGAPPVVVTAVATPTALRFTPGDGSPTVSCPGPGLPWVPGASTLCKHIYQRASTGRSTRRYAGVVTTVWYVRWFSTTGASGMIGPIQMPQGTSVKVVEAEAVLRTA